MAVLTSSELAEVAKAIAKGTQVDWVKGDINAALQAIEDWFESERTTVSGLIDAATAFSFTNAHKKTMIRFFLRQKFRREA